MEVLAVAEDLATEFVDLPSRPRRTAGVPVWRRPLSEQDDALDVSLHDHELHGEVVLTAHLIIAANESETRLSQEQVDRILGVA